MKNEFSWYLSSNAAAAQKLWKDGILTVDANVLLDLYRYHSATCESILVALESFAGRIWIPRQAAIEFFRNRKKVIASSEQTFREATSAIDDLDKSVTGGVGKLRGFRLVPRPALDALSTAITSAINEARADMEEAAQKHPNYLEEDPVLERILRLFDGRVGPAMSPERYAELCKEGKRRFEAKIPPGYEDGQKDEDKKYGDFLLWSQLMEFAKEAGSPIVHVTSERKEDWWEREYGKTLGPRQELVEEFFVTSGQQIYLYQTEHFLRIAAEQAGRSVNEEAVEEIRELDARRARKRTIYAPAVEVEQSPIHADQRENYGFLEIQLLREVNAMTGSGRFDPQLGTVPAVSARVLSAPDNCPPLVIHAGTGTTFDFNVHLRSSTNGTPLPVGLYIIDYSAECDSAGTSGLSIGELEAGDRTH
ncbi:PIN-like domain-containing protein [Rhizobium ecuadorense]|uniref:PIN-like domain-containing protein n=1 Tax=Rhizobium ecuadorense TaxID=1671795 RepID=UPI000673B692|nr:PIN domain-containing protein [Rhizobium ecuadorense]